MSKKVIIISIIFSLSVIFIWRIVSYYNWKYDPFRPLTEEEKNILNSKNNNSSKTPSVQEKSEFKLNIDNTLKTKSDLYLELSKLEKINYCKDLVNESNLIISRKYPIAIPENSILYIITDSIALDTLTFKKRFNFPIIVRFSDRQVTYSGNSFADGGLDRKSVGAAYEYGNYASEGWTRDIQIYQASESGNRFIPYRVGYITNNLGGYELFDFEKMEQLLGLPGAYRDIITILDYLGKVADNISKSNINLKTNNSYFFFSNNNIHSEGKNIARRRKD